MMAYQKNRYNEVFAKATYDKHVSAVKVRINSYMDAKNRCVYGYVVRNCSQGTYSCKYTKQ